MRESDLNPTDFATATLGSLLVGTMRVFSGKPSGKRGGCHWAEWRAQGGNGYGPIPARSGFLAIPHLIFSSDFLQVPRYFQAIHVLMLASPWVKGVFEV